MNDESESLASEASFLSKAGLLTLLAGAVVFAVAVLLDKPAEGGYIFAGAVIISLCMSAFAKNDRVSTFTLCADFLLISVTGLLAFVRLAI